MTSRDMDPGVYGGNDLVRQVDEMITAADENCIAWFAGIAGEGMADEVELQSIPAAERPTSEDVATWGAKIINRHMAA